MTLPIPLTVRLSNARTDRHIERDLKTLGFRSAIPGGFASAQFSLDRPLASSPDELAYYTDVDIYDARNANCVWCGRLEDPGRGVGGDGQIWHLAAVGPSAHAQDRTVPRIYVDRDLTRWQKFTTGGLEVKSGTVQTLEYDPDVSLDAIVMQFPSGASLPTNALLRVNYPLIREAGQRVARFDYKHIEGRISASLFVYARMYPTPTIERSESFSTTQTGNLARVMTTNFSDTKDILEMNIAWTGGATTVADDLTWSSIGGLYIMAQRKAKDGTVVGASGYTDFRVLAHEVVADLLGELLPMYDGANATIATTTFGIEQMAYPDGVTPAAILNDLMGLEPNYYWVAWDKNPLTDKYRFEWATWPTTVAYDADVSDGYTSTGSAEGLYNSVMVRWRDTRGKFRQTRASQTVPELTDVGLTRDGFVNLADELAGSPTAVQAADAFLDEHATPPNQGRLTIARPIYDYSLGRSVMPWEIRPGKLIRVRGILANSDSLNATSRDGVTVFKVVAVDYDTASASATLELDNKSVTMAHLLAARKEAAPHQDIRLRRRR